MATITATTEVVCMQLARDRSSRCAAALDDPTAKRRCGRRRRRRRRSRSIHMKDLKVPQHPRRRHLRPRQARRAQADRHAVRAQVHAQGADHRAQAGRARDEREEDPRRCATTPSASSSPPRTRTPTSCTCSSSARWAASSSRSCANARSSTSPPAGSTAPTSRRRSSTSTSARSSTATSSPRTCCLDGKGYLKVVDFGFAKKITPHVDALRHARVPRARDHREQGAQPRRRLVGAAS